MQTGALLGPGACTFPNVLPHPPCGCPQWPGSQHQTSWVPLQMGRLRNVPKSWGNIQDHKASERSLPLLQCFFSHTRLRENVSSWGPHCSIYKRQKEHFQPFRNEGRELDHGKCPNLRSSYLGAYITCIIFPSLELFLLNLKSCQSLRIFTPGNLFHRSKSTIT